MRLSQRLEEAVFIHSDDDLLSVLTEDVIHDMRVGSFTTAHQIAAGSTHTCVLLTSGEIWCWGLNDHGQIGANTLETCTWESDTLSCSTVPLQVVTF